MSKKKRSMKKGVRTAAAVALAALIAASTPAAIQAAESEATVSSREVSQGINSHYDGNKTDFTVPSIICDKGNGQWGYINNGVVQNVLGLYPNWHGWWIIENDWVNFNANGVIRAGNG